MALIELKQHDELEMEQILDQGPHIATFLFSYESFRFIKMVVIVALAQCGDTKSQHLLYLQHEPYSLAKDDELLCTSFR